jgi:hypothetical protein
LVYFIAFWYILWLFGTFFPLWVWKSGNPGVENRNNFVFVAPSFSSCVNTSSIRATLFRNKSRLCCWLTWAGKQRIWLIVHACMHAWCMRVRGNAVFRIFFRICIFFWKLIFFPGNSNSRVSPVGPDRKGTVVTPRAKFMITFLQNFTNFRRNY